MEEQLVDEQIIRVTDILEQVRKLNQMIDFHENDSRDTSMLKQYQYMREQFLKELRELLAEFQIELAA